MKRLHWVAFVGILCLAALIEEGCAPPNTPPTFQGVYWATENVDPSFWTNGAPNGAYAFRYFAVSLQDAEGPDDIVLIQIIDPTGNSGWTLKDSERGIDAYNSSSGTWGGWGYYSSSDPNRIRVGQYTAYAKDSAGHEVRSSFEVDLPGMSVTNNYSYLYTDSFAGSTSDAWPMLPRASLISATNDGTTLSIKFSLPHSPQDVQSVVYDGYVWFYDVAGNYICGSDYFRNTINTGAGIHKYPDSDITNTLDLTASDLDLGGHSLSDIKEYHVVLTDGSQYASPGSTKTSYDHRSISAKGGFL